MITYVYMISNRGVRLLLCGMPQVTFVLLDFE